MNLELLALYMYKQYYLDTLNAGNNISNITMSDVARFAHIHTICPDHHFALHVARFTGAVGVSE
jgi:hypothetical protein